MKGLILALGKPKGEPSAEEESDDAATTYAREAYAALQDKDEEGFVQALLGLKSCAMGDE